jgi:vesicle-fusing ATPase
MDGLVIRGTKEAGWEQLPEVPGTGRPESGGTAELDVQEGRGRSWGPSSGERRRFPPEQVLACLAEKIDLRTTKTDDLVAPAYTMTQVDRIITVIEERNEVNKQWSFATRGGAATGVSVWLSGGEGMGKTTAARVIAKRLDRPLYSADLSQLIGRTKAETLQNLSALFEAGSKLNAILLIENADVLLRQRSDKDASDDAYLITSYMIQQLKDYDGVMLLEAERCVDGAVSALVTQRLQLGFPDAPLRTEIWKRAFPPEAPLADGIRPEALAQINLSGGSICQAARVAASLAAKAGRAISSEDLKIAIQDEMIKMGRCFTKHEMDRAFGP